MLHKPYTGFYFFNYWQLYGNATSPQFIEGATFKIILPVSDRFFASNQDGNQVGNQDVIFRAVNWQIKRHVSIEVNDGINDGINEGTNEGTKRNIIEVVKLILSEEGLRVTDIAIKIGRSISTIERYLKLAKTFGIIEFSGSTKTGGYAVTKSIRDYIENETHGKISKK